MNATHVNNKSLLVYYSRPGFNWGVPGRQVNGNTKIVAQMIKSVIECDEYEIQPQIPYTEDYDEISKLIRKQTAKKEVVYIAHPQRVPDITKYNVVFIGFPIWLDTYPALLNDFFNQYDKSLWKHKDVALFCTHEGSVFGNSINDLKAHCNKDINVISKLDLIGHKASNALPKVKEWLKTFM